MLYYLGRSHGIETNVGIWIGVRLLSQQAIRYLEHDPAARLGRVACILGGHELQGVANGHLPPTDDAVIIAVTRLLISFIRLRAIFVYERYAWTM